MFKNLSKKNSGFSLVELMVAVSIFAIVMLIGTGAILAIVNGNKKNQSMQVAISNLNYAVENMTRTMKTGRDFPESGTYDEISFIDAYGETVAYRLDERAEGGDNLGSLQINQGGSGFISVTAPEIDIDTLSFRVVGTDVGDDFQPAVIIVINGTAKNVTGDLQTNFSLHTSVTQRGVDY